MERSDLGVLAIVEAQLTPEGIRWPIVAAELGLTSVFLTNDLDRYQKLPEFAAIFGRDDVSIVPAETNSAEAIVAAVRALPAADRVQGIYTQCDYNLPLVAAAARRLGLPGLSPEAAGLARNKLFTREACHAAGVPSPAFEHATDAEQAVAFAEKVGFPCVVKPMTESASTDVALCRDAAEVARQFTLISGDRFDRRGQPRLPGALVEEYCPGYEVSVETVTAGGEITVLGVTDKSVSPHPYFVEIGHVFPSCLPGEIRAELAGTAVAGLRAIGHDFGAAHTEVRMTAAGPRLIEINARLAGEDVPDMMDAALGIATRRQVLAMHIGSAPDLAAPDLTAPDLTGTARGGSATRKFTFHQTGTLRRVAGLDLARRAPGVVDLFVTAEPGDRVNAAVSNHEIYGQVRTVATTGAEAQRLAEAAFNQVSFLID
jgi:biotin carboxylase